MARRAQRLETEVGVFMKKYARQDRDEGREPLHRKRDRSLERAIRHMDADELDELLLGKDDDAGQFGF